MAEDIYFNKGKKQNNTKDVSFSDKKYTEKIAEEQLKTKPGTYAFGDIVTEKETISSCAPTKTKKAAEKEKMKKEKKHSKAGKALKAFTAMLLSLIILLSAGLFALSSYILRDYTVKDFSENVYTEASALMHSDSVYNILLMGIDTLDTANASRSDAMIIMSIDTKSMDIKLSSFLRDSYVAIPGHGNAKLNASCVYGGPQLVCDTIEYNFGIRIDDYAKIGYDMFIKVIDAVGGVDIPEIDATEAKALAKEGFKVNPGKDIHVNGTEALAYCRIRKGQSDFYRTERQREVISLVLKKLPKAEISTLIETAQEIAGTIECSINKNEFIPLLMKALPCLLGEIEQMHIPADGTWKNATKNYQSVLIVDFDKNKELLKDFIYG